MSETAQRILLIVITGGGLLIVLELVRRKRLLERYALLWITSATVLFVLAVWKGLLTTISLAIGIQYPPTLLFLLAAGFDLLLLMNFSLTNSRLTDQNKVLAQRLALLQRRLDEHEQQLARLSGESGSEGRPAEDELTGSRELSGTH